VTTVLKALGAFGRFWKNFLIGDAPELFVGALVVIGAAFALRDHTDVAIVVLPLTTIAFLSASVVRGRARS